MKKVCILGLFCIITQSYCPESKFAKVKRLHNTFCDNKIPTHLSPLFGALAVESSELMNYSLYGDQQHAAGKLIKKLLHVDIDKQLVATTYAPYTNFAPNTIVELLDCLEKTRNNNTAINNDSVINAIRPTIKGNKNPQRLVEFMQLFSDAIQEMKKGLHRPYFIDHVLLGFLYLHAKSNRDFSVYTQGIATKRNSSLIHREHVLKSAEDVQQILRDYVTNNNLAPCVQNFDAIANILVEARHVTDFPHLSSYRRQISYKQYPPVPDCVESAVYNLVFMAQHYFPDHVQKAMPEKIKKFFHDYPEHDNTDNAYQQKKHTAWMKLISDIPGIVYRKPEKYELDPSISNITRCLQLFLCNQTPYENQTCSSPDQALQQLNTLFASFSNQFWKIIYSKANIQDDAHAEVTFALKHDDKQQDFMLHILPQHAWITYDVTADHYINNRNALLFKQCGQKLLHEQTSVAEHTALKQLLSPWVDEVALAEPNNKALLCALPTNCADFKHVLERYTFSAPTTMIPMLTPE